MPERTGISGSMSSTGQASPCTAIALNLEQLPDALMAEVDALSARIAEPIRVGVGE